MMSFKYISGFGDNFGSFREGICNLVLATCKSTFAANGFSYEDYTVELNWLTHIKLVSCQAYLEGFYECWVRHITGISF